MQALSLTKGALPKAFCLNNECTKGQTRVVGVTLGDFSEQQQPSNGNNFVRAGMPLCSRSRRGVFFRSGLTSKKKKTQKKDRLTVKEKECVSLGDDAAPDASRAKVQANLVLGLLSWVCEDWKLPNGDRNFSS